MIITRPGKEDLFYPYLFLPPYVLRQGILGDNIYEELSKFGVSYNVY